MNLLVLGGTGEARELAVLLEDAGVVFESSLAGRVVRPRLPVGPVRVGGFGGPEGLARHLRERGVTAVVDATHPFAAGISANAAAACAETAVPLLRLQRPGWAAAAEAEAWHWVEDHEQAAEVTATLGPRPLLTIGRQQLHRFVGPLASADVLARVVDEPDLELPPSWRYLLDRGPYDLAGESALLADRDVLVTKDSGGAWTWPKMAAATGLGIPIVVVRRPPVPEGVEQVSDPAAAARWVFSRSS